eukprot:9502319-Pyramimonas_sp.AAC.1
MEPFGLHLPDGRMSNSQMKLRQPRALTEVVNSGDSAHSPSRSRCWYRSVPIAGTSLPSSWPSAAPRLLHLRIHWSVLFFLPISVHDAVNGVPVAGN